MIFLIIIVSIVFRMHYVNQTRSRCLHLKCGCDLEAKLCVDYTTSYDFNDGITYYFFK